MTATVFMTGSQLLASIAAKEASDEAERKVRERYRLRQAEQRRQRLIRRDIIHVSSNGPATFHAFFGAFCRAIYLEKLQVTASVQTASITTTRQIICWMGVRRFGRSSPAVGAAVERHYTSVLHGVSKIDRLIAERGLTVPADPMAAAIYLNRELGGVQ